CTTYAGPPVRGSVNDAAPPTGTADAGPIAVPAGCGGAVAVVGGAAVGAGAGVVGDDDVAPPSRGTARAASRDDGASARPSAAVTPPTPSATAPTRNATDDFARNVRRSSSSAVAGRRRGCASRTGHAPGSHTAMSRARQRPSSY